MLLSMRSRRSPYSASRLKSLLILTGPPFEVSFSTTILQLDEAGFGEVDVVLGERFIRLLTDKLTSEDDERSLSDDASVHLIDNCSITLLTECVEHSHGVAVTPTTTTELLILGQDSFIRVPSLELFLTAYQRFFQCFECGRQLWNSNVLLGLKGYMVKWSEQLLAELRYISMVVFQAVSGIRRISKLGFRFL